MIQKKTAFLDFEASSLGLQSYPISVGIVPLSIAEENFYTLIKPRKNWNDWNLSSQKIHQITQEKLQKSGKDADSVVKSLKDLDQKYIFYANSRYDQMWMNRLFEEEEHTINIMSYQRYLSYIADNNEKIIKKALKAANKYKGKTHHALDDAEHMRRIVQSAIKQREKFY